MKTIALASVALATLMAAPAMAADLPARAPAYKAPPPPVVVVSDWTGAYIGGSLGGRWSDTSWTTNCLQVGCLAVSNFRLPQGNPADLDSASVRGSIYGGYNWQFAPYGLVGIEGDFGFANSKKTLAGIPGTWPAGTAAAVIALDGSSVKETWDAGLRARLGFFVAPNVLLFATGGVSWLRVELNASCNAAGAWCSVSNSETISKTLTGWTVGGGVEGKIGQNWLARAEYRYADYGHYDFGFFPTQAAGTDFVGGHVDVRTHTFLVGLALQLGGPVTAKY